MPWELFKRALNTSWCNSLMIHIFWLSMLRGSHFFPKTWACSKDWEDETISATELVLCCNLTNPYLRLDNNNSYGYSSVKFIILVKLQFPQQISMYRLICTVLAFCSCYKAKNDTKDFFGQAFCELDVVDLKYCQYVTASFAKIGSANSICPN